MSPVKAGLSGSKHSKLKDSEFLVDKKFFVFAKRKRTRRTACVENLHAAACSKNGCRCRKEGSRCLSGCTVS